MKPEMNNLKQALENIGSTDSEIAARLHGVSTQSVWRWLTGRAIPRSEVLLDNPRLADAFALDAHEWAQRRDAGA